MSMSGLRPKWFVSRGSGVYTALVPADELPYSVNLLGVTRTMTADQVVGMTLVAEVEPSKQRYLLDRQSPFPGQALAEHVAKQPSASPYLKRFFAPDARVGLAEIPISNLDGARVDVEVLRQETTAEPISYPNVTAAVHADSLFPPQRPLPPSGQEPDETKKVYCSYWMHHGSCDYTQQGCKYKHEMPTDKNTLLKLGFRSMPKWWLEERAAKRARERGVESPVTKSTSLSRTPTRTIERGDRNNQSFGKGRAAMREEPNVKRSRFIDNMPLELLKYGEATAVTTSPRKAPLSAPVLSSPDTKAGSLTRNDCTVRTPLMVPNVETPPSVSSHVAMGFSLIDLSDSEEDSLGSRPLYLGTTTAPASPDNAVSSPSPNSTSSSDNDTLAEPQTPPTITASLAASNTNKDLTDEHPWQRRSRYQNQRSTKKQAFKFSPRASASRARKIESPTHASPKNNATASPIARGHATGLNASMHAMHEDRKPVAAASSKAGAIEGEK